MWFLENAWLIPVIPTVGYFVILLFGKRMPLKGAEVGFGTLAASFVLACGTVYQWIQRVDHYSAAGQARARSARWPRSAGRSSRPRPRRRRTRSRRSSRRSSASGRGGRSATSSSRSASTSTACRSR